MPLQIFNGLGITRHANTNPPATSSSGPIHSSIHLGSAPTTNITASLSSLPMAQKTVYNTPITNIPGAGPSGKSPGNVWANNKWLITGAVVAIAIIVTIMLWHRKK